MKLILLAGIVCFLGQLSLRATRAITFSIISATLEKQVMISFQGDNFFYYFALCSKSLVICIKNSALQRSNLALSFMNGITSCLA